MVTPLGLVASLLTKLHFRLLSPRNATKYDNIMNSKMMPGKNMQTMTYMQALPTRQYHGQEECDKITTRRHQSREL